MFKRNYNATLFLFIVTLFIALGLGACNKKSKSEILRQNAIDNVEDYLTKNLNNHETYKSISYDTLKPIDNTFKIDNDTIKRKYVITGYSINHKYQAKNEMGMMAAYNQKFFMTDKLEVTEVQEITK